MLDIEKLRHQVFMHGYRVETISIAIAKKLNLESTIQNDLKIAAYNHDIGKLYIKDTSLLSKKESLTVSEFNTIKEHSQLSYEYMLFKQCPERQAIIARDHHEYIDGTGYPNSKKGKEISLATRIITISDIFDALITNRPYRPAYTYNNAFDIMNTEMKNKIDLNIFRCLLDIVESGELDIKPDNYGQAIS